MSRLRRVVVVGNGIAGVTAADTLRRAGHDGAITLVGDERHAAYSRPALSKALLREDGDQEAHLLPPPAHGAEERLGVAATALDVHAREVLLDSGDRLPYDGLVIATGCRPRRLAGADGGPDQVTLRTLDDARRLRGLVAARPSVVVVGGGPLGMEIASGCLESGCEVTVVSDVPPLALQLGTHLSDVVVRAALARGLRLVTTGAVGLEREGRTRVVLADGSRLDADLVVTAIGDLPNVEWLATSGLLRDGGLVADGHGRVGPGVVAAGDVAVVPTPSGMRRVPLWSAAIEQSKAAATALVRGEADLPADPRPYFWTEQFGLAVKAVGHLPLVGAPTVVDGASDEPDGRVLLHWGGTDGGTAVAVNYRIPIPRLRRLPAPPETRGPAPAMCSSNPRELTGGRP